MKNIFSKLLLITFASSLILNSENVFPESNFVKKNSIENAEEASEINLYKLGVGDKLRVDIELIKSLDLSVLPDGTINLPRVGSIYIENLTINEAKNLITKSYNSILRKPEVFLDLISTRPIVITIFGEVQKPGIYSLNLNRLNTITNSDDGERSIVRSSGWPTIIDAIQKAGGLTTKADLTSITLKSSYKLEPKTKNINLWSFLDGKNNSKIDLIYDGDSIYIPKAKEVIAENITKLSKTNISPSTITVNVIGEVKRPGRHDLQTNSTISQAIFAAGGLNRRANKRVKLVRLKSNGTVDTRKINFTFDGEISSKTNPALIDRDTIVVSRNFWSSANDTLKDTVAPVNPIVNSYSLYKILNNE